MTDVRTTGTGPLLDYVTGRETDLFDLIYAELRATWLLHFDVAASARPLTQGEREGVREGLHEELPRLLARHGEAHPLVRLVQAALELDVLPAMRGAMMAVSLADRGQR